MAAGARPDILVIWGDDIGNTNLSCYSDGPMDYRAAFITGQSVYRTGLSKVGAPGADVGLSAEEEPELPDYASNEDFPRLYELALPRGVVHAWATDADDDTVDPKFGRDGHVGVLLDLLDELGIAEDTILVYSTDNGPHVNSWPDAGTTPFRSEKNTNWEGAFRVPELVRWPGKIPAGEVDRTPRQGFRYFSDDGDVLRLPKLFNLRTHPYERADITSNTYWDWFLDHDFIVFYATAIETMLLETFKELPPRQEAASFTIDHAVAKLHAWLTSGR